MARSFLSPGFRFHPTDVELAMYYLKRKISGKKLVVDAIAEVNIYDFSPWDLPDKSNLKSGDLEWFFFCPKSRKYSSGSRTNRATETGYWKATGKDRLVEYQQRTVAVIKTLIFHLGHAPKGRRTDWVMHEYRMEDKNLADAGVAQDTYVLCKIFKKSGAGPKNGAQYGAPFNEEEWDEDNIASCSEPSAVLGTLLATTAPSHNQNVPPTLNTGLPQSTCGTSLTEPGTSTVTSIGDMASLLSGPMADVDEKQKNPATFSGSLNEAGPSNVTPFFDNETLTNEEIASVYADFTKALEKNDKNEVENLNWKKSPNKESCIYKDLPNLFDLPGVNDGLVNMFDRDDYALDAFITMDDLDVDL